MEKEIFKDFEIKVLKILVSDELVSNNLKEVIENAEFVGYEYTGAGYFLTVQHPILPQERIVCHEPVVIGEHENIQSGFVIFLENKELTLECHSWGELEIPEDYRDRDIEIQISKELSAKNI